MIVTNMFVTNKIVSVELSAMPPISRRERPAKPALSLEAIVAAALRLMETEATERLTMRRLAAELDTGPASLYVYVSNTAELCAHVLDSKLGELDLKRHSKTPWLDRLTGLLMDYVELLIRSPALSRSALFSRPSGENYMAVVELILRLLTEGGASLAQAAWGVDVLLQSATAGAVEWGAREASASEVQGWDALTAAIEGADPKRFPLIAESGLDLMSGDGPDRGRWAFAALATGIVATPRPVE